VGPVWTDNGLAFEPFLIRIGPHWAVGSSMGQYMGPMYGPICFGHYIDSSIYGPVWATLVPIGFYHGHALGPVWIRFGFTVGLL
jgi:hypothetical protein